jgi:hypothetical protein
MSDASHVLHEDGLLRHPANADLDVVPLQAPDEAGKEANQGFDFFAIELLQDVVPGVDHAGQQGVDCAPT